MSRSRRSTSIVPVTTSESEKQDKRKANRVLRKAVRLAVLAQAEITPVRNEVSDIWCMAKDGKTYVDAKEFPKAMRK